MVFVTIVYLVASVVAGYVATVVLFKWLAARGEKKAAPRAAARSTPALSQQGATKEDASSPAAAPETSPRDAAVTKLMMKRGATKDHLQKLKIGRHRSSPSGRTSLGSSPPPPKSPRSADEPPPLSHPIFCPPVEPITDEQREKMAELKTRMAECIIPHFADDHSYWDVDKAEAMMRDAVKWRNSLEPIDKYRDLVSLSLAVQLSVLMTAKDKFGRTICYFAPRRHNANVRDVDASLRVMVWFMDHVWAQTKDTHYKKFVVLFNMRGFSLKNNDLAMVRAFLPILQGYYPEVVGRILLVEYPFVVYGLWKVIRPWLDPNTQNKVQFIKAEELSDHFDPNAVPAEIGGLWEAPEPEVDLWDPDFDPAAWKIRPWETVEDNGVYRTKQQ